MDLGHFSIQTPNPTLHVTYVCTKEQAVGIYLARVIYLILRREKGKRAILLRILQHSNFCFLLKLTLHRLHHNYVLYPSPPPIDLHPPVFASFPLLSKKKNPPVSSAQPASKLTLGMGTNPPPNRTNKKKKSHRLTERTFPRLDGEIWPKKRVMHLENHENPCIPPFARGSTTYSGALCSIFFA